METVLLPTQLLKFYLLLLFLLGGLWLTPASRLLGQNLPNRLSDEQFWKMIVDFSEPTGVFPSENFASNEVGASWIVPELLRTAKQGSVYLGVGPEQNFSYVAALRPKMAFIVDIRRQAMLQQLYYKMLFEIAPDRVGFMSLLFSRPRPTSLPVAASTGEILNAFDQIPPNHSIYSQTLDVVLERLLYTHRFGLSLDDIENLRHISQVLVLAGPHLGYTSGRLLGRAAQQPFGNTSRLEIDFRRGAFGTIDTVRLLVTTTPTGRTDTTLVSVLGPGGSVKQTYRFLPAQIDFDSVWAAGGRAPAGRSSNDSIVGSTDFASLAKQILKGVPKSAAGPTSSSNVDFSSLMVQTDSAGVMHSFLSSDANYARVRELQLRNLVIPLVGDFSGPKTLRAVGSYLRTKGATVGAFYTSNVEEYLFQFGTWRAFYANVAALPVDESSTFIRAFLGGTMQSVKSQPSRRVDLAVGSIGELMTVFLSGKLTGYADLMALSRQ